MASEEFRCPVALGETKRIGILGLKKVNMSKGKLTLKHVDGSAMAGLENTYSGPIVTFGSSQSSHVCFDAEDHPHVAPVHAEVRFEPVGAILIDPTGAGVEVNGVPVQGPVVLRSGDIIRLGAGGPTARVVSVELPSQSASSPTVSGARAATGTSRSPSSPTKTPVLNTVVGQRQVRPAPGELPPVRLSARSGQEANASFPSPMNAPQHAWTGRSGAAPSGHDARRLSTPTAGAPTPGRGIGLNTLQVVVQSAVKKERSRSRTVLLLVSLIVLLGSVFAAIKLAPKPKPVKDFDWSEVARTANPSICVAMKRTPGQSSSLRPFGTTWSVAKGVFATNSHVADEFNESEEGVRLEIVIRTPGASPQELRVKSVRLHPGYLAWNELLRKYNPFDPERDEFLSSNSFIPCDVALMYIEEEDIPKQPPFLKLAPDSFEPDYQLKLFTLGYPMEHQVLNVEHPAPVSKDGTVSKITDDFGGAVSPSKTTLIEYSWPSAGGASGSPVFNASGEVISLLSAGNNAGMLNGGRVSSGNAAGIPVRLLKELLENRADSSQSNRSKEWQREFERLFTKGSSAADKITRIIATQFFKKNNMFDPESQRLVRNHSGTATLSISGGHGSTRIAKLPVSEGPNIIVIVSKDRPTNVSVTASESVDSNNRSFGPWAWYGFSARKASSVSATVVAAPGSDDGTTNLIVHVYGVAPK